MNTKPQSPNQSLASPGAPGPAAHEDFTLAEHLKQMREPVKAREGCEAFRTPEGELLQIPVERVRQFVENYGPLHAGNYREETGWDWRDDFAALQD